MTAKQSHLSTLLETLCETLVACEGTETRCAATSFEARRARDIRAATEPLAISCLDEELGDVRRIKDMVYRTASMPLITHLISITEKGHSLDRHGWSMLLMTTDVPKINQLLDVGLRPTNAAMPFIERITTPDRPLAALFFDRIVENSVLEIDDIDRIFSLRFQDTTEKKRAFLRQALQSQIRRFPVVLAEDIAKSMTDQMGIYRAAGMVLAGMSPKDIATKSRPNFRLADAFLTRLSSNHGLMDFHRMCGPVDTFLANQGDFIGWLNKVQEDLRPNPLPDTSGD